MVAMDLGCAAITTAVVVLGIHLLFAIGCCDASEGWMVVVPEAVTATLPSEDLCLSTLRNSEVGDSVYLSSCSDFTNTKYNQQWRYENHMLSVPVTSTEDRLCLAGSLHSNSVFLDECKQGETSQNWVFDDVNYRIQNGYLLFLEASDGFDAALQVSNVTGSAFRMLYQEAPAASPRLNAANTRSLLENGCITVELVNIKGAGCPSAGIDLRGSGSLAFRGPVVRGSSYVLSFKHGGMLNSSCKRPSTGSVQVPTLKSPVNFTSPADGSCKEEKILFNATSSGDIVIYFKGTNGDRACGPVVNTILGTPAPKT